MLTAALITACILSGLLILGVILAVSGIALDKPKLLVVAVPCYFVGAFTGLAWLFTLVVWIVTKVSA